MVVLAEVGNVSAGVNSYSCIILAFFVEQSFYLLLITPMSEKNCAKSKI